MMSGIQYKWSKIDQTVEVKEDLTKINGPFQDYLKFLPRNYLYS